MGSFKDPSFQDRVASAANAKQKALEKLRAKPAPDEAVVAARAAAAARREAAEQAKRDEKLAKIEAARAEKAAAAQAAAEAAAAAAAAAAVPAIKLPTPEELKAARDKRYADRKNRK